MLTAWAGSAAGNLALLVLSVAACALCANVVRAMPGTRSRSGLMLTIGLAGLVVGYAARTAYPLRTGALPPFPSLADAGFLIFPAAVCLCWPIRMPPRTLSWRRPLLDGVIVAGAVFLVFWVIAFHEALAATTHNLTQLSVALAYCVGDVAMVTVSVMFLATTTHGYRRSVVVVTAAIVTIAVADGLALPARINREYPSVPIILSQAVGLILIGIGAVITKRNATSGDTVDLRADQIRTWLPYLPLPAAVGVGLAQLWHAPGARPTLLAAVVLGGGALARQMIVLSDNRRLVAQLTAQTRRDPLTGLANRQLLTERLDTAIRSGTGRCSVAVLVLGLHDFALVNDNLGRTTGDALLRMVADRLVQSAPKDATVARLDGDEFAILVPAAPDPPHHLGRTVIAVFDDPFHCDGEELFMHASVGMAAAIPLDLEGFGADELIRRADLAMYRAKRSGLGGVQVWAPDARGFDTGPVASYSRPARSPGTLPSDIQILGQLRRVVENRGLTLVYQPKISLASGATVGVEALVRWPHPDFGLLLPDQFLPLVGRHSGLMAAVTDVVLCQAVGAAAEWYAAGPCELSVAVNLFAPSLTDAGLPERISAVLAANQLPARLLTVEITEHFLLANLDRARSVVHDLRDIGLRISIDDFGSGYATMSYLRDLPINELKLDRQFIAPVLDNPRSAAIVQSILGLTRALGITSVAEGVEDAAIASWLRENHCDIAQGYHFGRPVPANNIRTLSCG